MKKFFIPLFLALSPVLAWAQPAISYQASSKEQAYPALSEPTYLPFVGGKDFHGTFFGKDTQINPSRNTEIAGIPFFEFDFCGQSVNSFAVLGNGVLLLGQDSVLCPSNLKTTGLANSNEGLHILNFPTVIRYGSSFSEAEVYASASENDPLPTRIAYQTGTENGDNFLSVEFRNLKVFLPGYKNALESGTLQGDPEDTVYNLSYQIRLWQSDGRIEILYDCPAPAEGQSIQLSTGLRSSRTDRMGLELEENDWHRPLFSSAYGRSLPLNDSVYPASGFTYVFSKPEACQKPDPADTLTGISSTSTQSSQISMRAQKPQNTDLTFVFFSASPTLEQRPVDGQDYALGDSLGQAVLATRASTESVSVSRNNLEPGTYYLHAFQANYLCTGGISYSESPQLIPVKTLFGAPEALLGGQSDSTLALSIQAYENENVLLAMSERAWDENLDASGMIPTLRGEYHAGDTLNLSSCQTKSYPPMRIVYMGPAKDTLFKGLQASTPYHFILFSYSGSAGNFQYSTVCKQYGFRTSGQAPLRFDFKSDAVQKLSSITQAPSMPAGWSRSISNPVASNHFCTRIGMESFSVPANDRMKRLELYANFGSSARSQVVADAISPAFRLPWSSPYRVVLKLQWLQPAFGNDRLDGDTYALQEGDSLFVEISSGQGWQRIASLTASDSLQASSSDEEGYHTFLCHFSGTEGQETRIRLIYTTGSQHKFCVHSMQVEPVLEADMGYPVSWNQYEASDHYLQIGWESPTSGTGSSFQLQYRKQSQGFYDEAWQDAGSIRGQKAGIHELESATAYQFRVRKEGNEVWSEESPAFHTHFQLPLNEDFQELNILTQAIPKAWYAYTGLLYDSCTSLDEAASGSWSISSANLDGNSSNRAAFVRCNTTGGAWFLTPEIHVAEYPVEVLLSFDLSLGRYASGGYAKDSILEGNRSFKVLQLSEEGCFDSSHVLYQVDTAGSDGLFLKNLMNTPVEIRTTASGSTRFAFYWENTETNNSALSSTSLFVDNLLIDYAGDLPCDSVYSLQAEVLDASSARLSWGGSASSYALYCRESGKMVFDTLWSGQTEVLLEGLSPATTYEYAVQAACDQEAGIYGQVSALNSFTTSESRCQAPQAIYLCDSSFDFLEFCFSGEAGNYHARYREVDAENQEDVFFSVSPLRLEGLDANTEYILQVRSICAAGDTSGFGPEIHARTTAYPECPAPTGLQAEILAADAAWLQWESDPAHLSYKLRYRSENEQTCQDLGETEETDYMLTGLETNTPYVWEIRAVCAYTESDSVQSGFTIEDNGRQDSRPASLSVSYRASALHVHNPEGLLLKQISLYDAQGRLLTEKKLSTQGDYVLPFADWKGILIVRIVLVEGTHIQKLIIP